MVPLGAMKLPRGVAGGEGQRRRREMKLGHGEDEPELGLARTALILNRCTPKLLRHFKLASFVINCVLE